MPANYTQYEPTHYITHCRDCGQRKDICNCKQTIATTPIVKPASLLSPAEFSNDELIYLRTLLTEATAEYTLRVSLIIRINQVLASRLGGF